MQVQIEVWAALEADSVVEAIRPVNMQEAHRTEAIDSV